MIPVSIDPHPALRAGLLQATFPQPLVAIPSPPWMTALLTLEAAAPLRSDDETRARIRDLLRHGGYKPTGRGKPSSEYLRRAAGDGSLASINLAVDACNAVSLHSGLPISLIDLDRAVPPLRVGIAAAGQSFVFNASGQTINLEGLLCLFDAEGPCANAVKDAQRTKTADATSRTLSIVWACTGLEERLAAALAWYRELLERAGATIEDS
jgi:DNA/RNA-binding domain of Phe-tRNA-synthetase-like protein